MSTYENNPESNSERFFELANKLDNLLKQFNENIYIINNSNIHLPRNHPEYLYIWKPVIYQKFTKFNDSMKITIYLLFLIPKYILIILSELVKRSDKKMMKIKYKEIDYLFISHQLQETINDYDFYYGDMLSKLSTYNNIVRLLISHSSFKFTKNMSKLYHSIFLDNPINKKLVLIYLINNIKSTLQLLIFCKKNKYTYYEILSILIGQIENFNNYKLTWNVESIFSQLPIKNLVVTFEGNAIERSIFFLCSKYKIKSFGYQHAPIIKGQHSIFRKLHINLNPDIILCSGSYTQKLFEKKLKFEIPALLLGSPKHVNPPINNYASKNKSNIILIPDGNAQSINTFIELGHELYKLDSTRIIRIRSHPLFLSFIEKQKNHLSLGQFEFIQLSKLDLNEDLIWAQWVIYQNSAVSIQAIKYNCGLVYFEHPLADVDPLHDIKRYHHSGKNVKEIDLILSTQNMRSLKESEFLKKFALDYFSPIENNLDKIFTSIIY